LPETAALVEATMKSVHRTALATTLFATALTTWHSFPEAQGPQAGQQPERRRYVVEFNQFGPDSPGAVRAAGGDVVHQFPRFRMVAAWLPEAALMALQNNPNVNSIEEDPQRFPFAETIPYGIPMVQANLVSDANASNRKICIIDSGYSLGHPDLPVAGVTGVDDIGAGPWSVDRCGHGTHVAGTIAALGQNSTGVVGVLPGGAISLHIVKVFGDSCAWAYASDLAAALNQCQAAGANVVNMSLGGSVSSTLERNAFDAAYAAGVLPIAAAGNGGNLSISYPAGYSSVVSVAAVNEDKALAGFSQRNADVELAAPGIDVLSTVPWFEENSVTADNAAYSGTWIEFAARTGSGGVSGVLANGGLCDSVGSWTGEIVLCERGITYFSEKVANVEAGGGIATVIYNNLPGGFLGTLINGPSQKPAIGISQEDGQVLVASTIGQPGTVVSFQSDTGGGYEAWSGTSMATPHVAGVAALIWSYYPTRTNADVRSALNASAEDLGVAGRDTSYGYGLVRAEAALDILSGVAPPPPPPVNIVLSAARRGKKVELQWSGATSATVDIFRNGQLHVSATPNDGSHSDAIPGKGSYVYQVCATGTTSCSNPATVVF
jgi:subtilisin family serine protease